MAESDFPPAFGLPINGKNYDVKIFERAVDDIRYEIWLDGRMLQDGYVEKDEGQGALIDRLTKVLERAS